MDDLLPNCLPRERGIDWEHTRGGVTWLYLFCASCHCSGGRVMKTELPKDFAFYLCQPCADKYGAIADMMMVPDDAFGIQQLGE